MLKLIFLIRLILMTTIMLELLINIRLAKLRRQYASARQEAIKMMHEGDISSYLPKLEEVGRLKAQLQDTYRIEY